MGLDTTTVKASCHCKSNVFDISFPTSTLPRIAGAAMCHCTACRKCTGSTFVGYLDIDHALFDRTRPPESLAEYRTSPDVSRYFCSQCGAHMIFYRHSRDEWSVATGILDRVAGVFEIRKHIFVADTIDGGVLNHLKDGHPWYHERSDTPIYTPPPPTNPPSNPVGSRESIHARCHCGNVEIILHPPSYTEVPPQISHFILSHSNPDKWRASHCLCTFCRATTGFVCTSCIFVSDSHLTIDHSKLTVYHSSPEVERKFCGVCGANVLYRHQDQPMLWDLTVALLDTGDEPIKQAMDRWIDFREKVSSADDAIDEEFKHALLEGVKGFTG